MSNILLLLDLSNLWNGCKAQFGKRARINFKVLIDKAKLKKHDAVTAVAFVTIQPEKNQENLIKKLSEFGIKVITKTVTENYAADFCDEMEQELTNSLATVDTVVLGSGNSQLLTILKSANEANKKTLVIAFGNTLDKELAAEADDIRLLVKQDTITQ